MAAILQFSCDRASDILHSLSSHIPMDVPLEELQLLQKLGLVHHHSITESESVIRANLELTKEKYYTKLHEFDQLRHDMQACSEASHSDGFLSYILAQIRLGKRSVAQQEFKMLQKQLVFKERELATIKNEFLASVTLRDLDDKAFKVYTDAFVLSPMGEIFLTEISARPHIKERDLNGFIQYLHQVDAQFRQQITLIQKYISGRKFPPVLLPYLAHLNFITQSSYLDTIATSEAYDTDSTIPEERVIDAILKSLYSIQAVYPFPKLYTDIKNQIAFTGISNPALDLGINHISKILGIWASFDRNQYPNLVEHPLIMRFLSNFREIIHTIYSDPQSDPSTSSVYTGLQFGRFANHHDILAALLLAFSSEPLQFNYFYPRVNHGAKGGKFFATVLTLLPWSPEETWQMLKRAESQILMAQSVQFIPELLEYGLMLNLNLDLLVLTSSIDSNTLNFWKHVILPCVMIVNLFSLDDQIADYVQTHPLAYITNPRPYYYGHGYYYRSYWYSRFYHPHHYYHSGATRYQRGYLFTHRTSGVRTGMGSSSSFSGGTGGGTRGRYSSLHHHTIG